MVASASSSPSTLAGSRIGEKTGLVVVGLRDGDQITTDLSAETVLSPGVDLLVMGHDAQREHFREVFGAGPSGR